MAIRLRGPNARQRDAAHINPERIMSITAHLDELRRRLMWAIASTLIATAGLAIVWKRLLPMVLWPWLWADVGRKAVTHPMLLTLSPTEPFLP
ncbi:MAG: twin-arginine translocase subunit TatC [Firmicutes bacterium]|jgi:Sec-independent protein secretion pathway component TatC|nr:twin-arginine translocase subunit TatC [Bacillota bacterium]MCL5972191.1 twin-arginine translocase subunit TatC [Bacillota bacterium]